MISFLDVKNRRIFSFFMLNLLYVIFFSALFFIRGNYEFIIYVIVLLSLVFLIIATDEKLKYPKSIFIGFTVWGIVHMIGGGLYFRGIRFYDLVLVPLLSGDYAILKYDQLAHVIANYVATILMFVIIKPHLRYPIKYGFALSIVLVMAGSGIGAMNEIVEFFAVVLTQSTGVGGYINTALDLIFNLIGGILAVIFIRCKKGNI